MSSERGPVDLEVLGADWRGRSRILIHSPGGTTTLVLAALGLDRHQEVALLRQWIREGRATATRGDTVPTGSPGRRRARRSSGEAGAGPSAEPT